VSARSTGATRNRFAAYVLNTEHHRRWHLDYTMGDPEVMESWGSLRWAPEWVAVNREAAPPFAWPVNGVDRLKVAFMVPQWVDRVDPEAIVELVERVHRLDGVSLALKGPSAGPREPRPVPVPRKHRLGARPRRLDG